VSEEESNGGQSSTQNEEGEYHKDGAETNRMSGRWLVIIPLRGRIACEWKTSVFMARPISNRFRYTGLVVTDLTTLMNRDMEMSLNQSFAAF
jgi:hypothetical protein